MAKLGPEFDLDPSVEGADKRISEFAEEIVAYSREYHKRRPDVPLRFCIEMGASRFASEHSSNRGRIVEMALAEIAARWVFTPSQIQPAE